MDIRENVSFSYSFIRDNLYVLCISFDGYEKCHTNRDGDGILTYTNNESPDQHNIRVI